MSAEPSPLVGRAALLTAIGRDARDGTGSVLTGARGSGGTRLLADAFAATRRSGLRAARLLHTGTARPAVSVTDGEQPDGRHPLALGLQVVFVDDAHLLDDDAGALLVDLARGGTAVVANATGSAGMPEALRRLIEEGRASTVDLPPLTRDEVAELAGHLLGDPVDGELASALTTASDGRPRMLAELVDDGVGARAIGYVDGVWSLLGPLPVGRSVRTAVIEAFSALPPEQRGWIAAVAQAGRIGAALTGRIAARDAVAAAAASNWTVVDGDATRVVSVAVRQAVLGALDLRARVAVLRRLVAATEAAGRALDDHERTALALWRIELGDPVDPAEARALALLPGTDPAARETLLRTAVDGGAPAGAELAEHLRHTRRPGEALELIDATLPEAGTDDELVALLRVRSLTTGVVERRSGDALAALDAHLAAHPQHPDLLAVRASMLLLEARPEEAVAAAEAALASPVRSAFATAFALMQLALGRRERGDLEGAVRGAERLAASGDVERALADGLALARWLPWEMSVAIGADTDVEAAVAAARAAVPADRSVLRRPPLSYTLGTIRTLRGDPGDAVRLLRDADSGSGAWREGWRPRILSELANAATLAGDLDDAAAVLERLRRIAVPPVQRARVDLAAAQLAHARGDAAAAQALVAAVAERGRHEGQALDAFDAVFAGIRYGDDAAPGALLALGGRPGGRGREAQRAYAAALVTGDADAVDRAAAALWEAGLRLFAIEAAARAAQLGWAAAGPRVVAWLARTPSLRLPGLRDRRAAGLTAREREVALLAAQGASDRAIAAELDISLRTAQTHLGRALAKLGIHRRTELRDLVVEP